MNRHSKQCLRLQRSNPVSALPAEAVRLMLLGTVHHDQQGFRKTLLALDRLRPERVLVELSPFAWAFRKRHGSDLLSTLRENLKIACARLGLPPGAVLRHPEIQRIRRQLVLPFEYRAALRYTRARHAALQLIDDSTLSSVWLRHWPELISASNLQRLVQIPPPQSPSAAAQYRLAAEQLGGDSWRTASQSPPQPAAGEDESERERERYLAHQLRCALSAEPCARILYLGGWRHLSPDPKSLRSLLADYRPEVHLLGQW